MGIKIGTLREIGVKKGDVVTFDEKVQYRFIVEWFDGDTVYGTAHDGGREFVDNWSVTDTNNWRILSHDAPTGPVRTVTRKEIVPGVYGDVRVGDTHSDKDGSIIMIAFGHVAPQSPYSAAELRAAIATLTEIADALEDV